VVASCFNNGNWLWENKVYDEINTPENGQSFSLAEYPCPQNAFLHVWVYNSAGEKVAWASKEVTDSAQSTESGSDIQYQNIAVLIGDLVDLETGTPKTDVYALSNGQHAFVFNIDGSNDVSFPIVAPFYDSQARFNDVRHYQMYIQKPSFWTAVAGSVVNPLQLIPALGQTIAILHSAFSERVFVSISKEVNPTANSFIVLDCYTSLLGSGKAWIDKTEAGDCNDCHDDENNHWYSIRTQYNDEIDDSVLVVRTISTGKCDETDEGKDNII
ncbi:MAG: hypothetical protein WC607_04960, partial [Candidatus Micrarchaeia archaeon]